MIDRNVDEPDTKNIPIEELYEITAPLVDFMEKYLSGAWKVEVSKQGIRLQHCRYDLPLSAYYRSEYFKKREDRG